MAPASWSTSKSKIGAGGESPRREYEFCNTQPPVGVNLTAWLRNCLRLRVSRANWHVACSRLGPNTARREPRGLSCPNNAMSCSRSLWALYLSDLTLQSAIVSAVAQFGWSDNRLFGLVNSSTALAVLGGALTFGILIRTKAAVQFSSEVVGQLLQVTWPSREETVRAATTVVVTTLFTAGLLAVYDFGLEEPGRPLPFHGRLSAFPQSAGGMGSGQRSDCRCGGTP